MDRRMQFDHVVLFGFDPENGAIWEIPRTLADQGHVGAVLLVGGLLAG